MRADQAVAETVAQLGVRHVFTLMSEETATLTEELAARGVRVVHTRHEHGAVGMADGYSRVSGQVGVAVVGRGPGLTNGLNALVAASRGGSRVVVLAGDSGRVAPAATTGSPSAGPQRLADKKRVDQAALLAAVGVRHTAPAGPAAAAAAVAAAITAPPTSGVVVVTLRADLLAADGAEPAPEPTPPASPPGLAADDLAALTTVLEETWAARRPVLLAGRGAVRAGARAALVRLGELTGALLGTTAAAKGCFAGEPYDVGVVGSFATAEASGLLVTADLVLAFGASLNQDTTYAGSIFGKARLVQVDTDPAALGRYEPVDFGAVADARTAAAGLAAELAARGHWATGFRTPEVARLLAERVEEVAVPDRGGPAGMDPRSLWITLDRLLPADRTIAVDGGNFQEWVVTDASVPDPRAFLWPVDYGAIGCGLGVALGAAVARPDRLTVLATGDGGLALAVADLDTTVRYGLNLLIVVNNNRALGSELHFLRARGYPGDSARYANPPYAEVARGLGMRAETVHSIDELAALRAWLATPAPKLLDCMIDPDIVADAKARSIG